jgi:glutaredoxin-related protein
MRMVMILWINGTFGAGKTSIANELVRLLRHARIYDPEQVGYMLRHVLTEPIEDFQDWPPWRQLVIETAAQVHQYIGGILVTPMTLLRRDYLQEIFDGLASRDLDVRHILVHADPDELARRIEQDQGLPEQTRRWRRDHLDAYQQALPWLAACADLIDTTDLSPAQAAREIAERI